MTGDVAFRIAGELFLTSFRAEIVSVAFVIVFCGRGALIDFHVADVIACHADEMRKQQSALHILFENRLDCHGSISFQPVIDE